jgi:hypothetical protein
MNCLYALIFLPIVLYAATFSPACDLHSTASPNSPASTVSTSLPIRATAETLYPSETEILHWYRKGEDECKEFLRNATTTTADNQFPPFYTNQDNIGQGIGSCRGRNTLFSLAGVFIFPFGPIHICPTYSKCWFGLMTCGVPTHSRILSTVEPKVTEYYQRYFPKKALPKFLGWSIKALRLLVRVKGIEIVVPELMYVPLRLLPTSQTTTDVIIGQYHLTIPDDRYTLEARLFEFYPGTLFDWPAEQLDVYGLQNAGNLYLGGNEGIIIVSHVCWLILLFLIE